MSRPKPPAQPPRATASSTEDDFAADLAGLDGPDVDDFGADLEALTAEPAKSDGSGALAASGGLAGLAGLITAARSGAGAFVKPGLATTATKLAGRLAGPANLIKQGYDVATGKQGAGWAAAELAAGEGARRYFRPERLVHPAVRMAQKAVAPVASALGAEGVAGMAAPLAVPLAGGLAGLAGSAGFLGALQHDANRDVPMDYTKQNLTEDIARALGRTGATDAQMDDPTHPAFRPDDSETVTAPGGGYTAALLRLLRAG
jgi:hypothetical protein